MEIDEACFPDDVYIQNFRCLLHTQHVYQPHNTSPTLETIVNIVNHLFQEVIQSAEVAKDHADRRCYCEVFMLWVPILAEGDSTL